MIYYTLKGPKHTLEIHDDKLRLIKRNWFKAFSKEPEFTDWSMESLSLFEISVPQYVLWGKIHWSTKEGAEATFRFSTNPLMVKKIERYLQRIVIRNHERKKKIA